MMTAVVVVAAAAVVAVTAATVMLYICVSWLCGRVLLLVTKLFTAACTF